MLYCSTAVKHVENGLALANYAIG